MFEDQQPINNEPPANLPAEDMFKDIEKETEKIDEAPKMPNALDSGMLKRKNALNIPREDLGLDDGAKEKRPILGKVIFGLVTLSIVGGLSYGAWMFYSSRGSNPLSELSKNLAQNFEKKENENQDVKPAEQKQEQQQPTETSSSTNNRNKNDSILFGDAADSDNDDVSDDEEKKLQTEVNNPDTDGDFLSDGDESKVWRTSPIKKDSDGDGFLDGQEIVNGYNPLGGGKYINPPLAIVRFVTSSESGFTYEIFVIKSNTSSAK